MLLTPLCLGTSSNYGSFRVRTTTDVTLCFTPYIDKTFVSGQLIYSWNTTPTKVKWTWYDAGDNEIESFITEIEIPETQVRDSSHYADGTNYTTIDIPGVIYSNSLEIKVLDESGLTGTRAFLYEVHKEGTISGNTYSWSQVAKIKDIENAINALPEVARTGCYDDLTCKPCVGDVQTYDWASDEEFPVIDEGTDNCDNRFKQLLRRDNSLYTAVVNDTGLTIDMRDFSNKSNSPSNPVIGPLRDYVFKTRMELNKHAYEEYFVDGRTFLISNTKGRGLQVGSGNDYGEMLLAMRDKDDQKRILFNKVDISLQSWNGPDSQMSDYTTDDGNVYIEIGTSVTVGSSQTSYKDTTSSLEMYWEDNDGYWVLRNSNGANLTVDKMNSLVEKWGEYLYIDNVMYQIVDYFKEDGGYVPENDLIVYLDHTDTLDYSRTLENDNQYTNITFRKEITVTVYTRTLTPQQTKNIWFRKYNDEYVQNPILRETVSLQGTDCDYIRVLTENKDGQDGKRCIITSIVSNDIRYEYLPNPTYNKIFYRKDYWKQISGGGGSIKVIDLLDDNE